MGKRNRRYFAVHAWLGLISGLFLVCLAVSGGIILFHKDLNCFVNSSQMQVPVPPGAAWLPFDTLAARVRAAYPDHDFNGFRDFAHREGTSIAVAIDRHEKYKSVQINPYTGEVLGEKRNRIVDWIYTFHYSFQIGRTGEWLALIFSLTLLGSVVTGFVVYRKNVWKALTFRIPISFQNWRKASSGLHRVLGVWAMLFNLVIGLSGFYLMLYLFVPEDDTAALPPDTNAPFYVCSIDECLRIARDSLPNLVVNYIKTPRSETDSVLSFWGDAAGSWHLGEFATACDINVHTMKVKIVHEADLDALTQTQLTLSTLHFGHYGGRVTEVLYLLFALCTSVLSITGFLLWWRRKASKPQTKESKSLTSTPPRMEA
jgi:uncharacterized iron-regulated membrane protein